MDDSTFIRYDSLGTLDSHVTCVTSLDDVLFLGNSYGDIRLVQGKESQVLHNHHGEITTLVCRRCYRTGRNDSLYLLSGTSIGNVYLHLVFLDKVTGSRILYKFVTGYSVFSICPHPEFDIFNFRRLANRLTVDFTKDVSKDSHNWKELPSLSISVESFILSLSNGGIYLVHNSNTYQNINDSNEFNGPNNTSRNASSDIGKERERMRSSNSFDQLNNYGEKYVIMCISLYNPYANMKMNWHKRYISWIDKEGFYVYLLPNFVSILYISSKHFGNPFYKRQQSLGFKEKMKKTERMHYLYNIIDNSELYVSTEESDYSPIPSSDLSRRSSARNTPRNVSQEDLDLLEVENTTNRDSSNNNTPSRLLNSSNNHNSNRDSNSSSTDKTSTTTGNIYRKTHMKRLRNRFVNHKYLRNTNSYGTMSRFLSDSVLVGCNNTLLCIKLVDDSDPEFDEYHNLLLSTFPNKEVIGYRDTRNSISCRRSSSVVRGYIDFKIVFPDNFNILHVLYSGQSQFNLIVFDEGPRNLADRDSWQCYLFEKYNRNGSVTRHKLNLPDQVEPGDSPREGRNKITNMIFNINSSGTNEMSMISMVHCESMSVRFLKGSLLSENVIIGAQGSPEISNKDYVYVCISNSLIRINYCNNYFNLLKYYISNCYNQNIVVSHFKFNLVSMLNSNIGCTNLGSDDKGRKYVVEYIGVFVDYILESRYYEGFKIILEVLNRYGKLTDLFGSVFTKSVRVRLEVYGFLDRLVDDLVEIIDEGNSLVYLEIVEWKLNNKVYTSLMNKIRTILVNQIYHLYNLFQDFEINMGIENSQMNSRTDFPDGSYFEVLILLNNLNSKSEVEIRDIYNMLYQFLQQTASPRSEESILSYSLSDLKHSSNTTNSTTVRDNSKNDSKDSNRDSNSSSTDKASTTTRNNRLEIYSLESEEMYNKMLCLKYYHKSLSEKLVTLNTRGVVFPSNKGSDILTETEGESWYIERAVVNCNICNSQRAVYDKIVSRLVNKVGGGLIDQNGFVDNTFSNASSNGDSNSSSTDKTSTTTRNTNNVLYFPCRHMVHERCQIRLINHVVQHDSQDTPVTKMNKRYLYFSHKLLDTCLTCLTK